MSLADDNATVLDRVTAEVLEAHRALLSAADLDSALARVLEKVGRAAQVDRVYIFQTHSADDGVEYASQRFEWVADDIKPQIGNPELQNIPLRRAGYSRWLEHFNAYRPIYGRIDSFPESERPTLAAQQIKSLLILPIFVRDCLWGFVGFDDCTRARNWTAAELDLLFAVTITLRHVFTDEESSGADAATVACMSLVASMLSMHAATLTETSVESLAERTRARLRTTVAAHRVLREHSPADRRSDSPEDETIDLRHLFEALQPYFAEIHACTADQPEDRRTVVDVAPLRLKISAALDLTMIAAEVLAVLAERCRELASAAVVGINLRRKNGYAVLTITARDRNGDPVPTGEPLDAMAFFMLRHLTERLNAKTGTTQVDGLLFRLVIPLKE